MSRLDRWDAGLVAALIALGTGLLLANLVLVSGAVVGLVFALYGTISMVPTDVSLSATRTFGTGGATPGSELTVTLEVENTGESVIPDLRVADGVPDACTVVAGSPRSSGPLTPGETVSIEYTIVLERGRFEFDQPTCRLRSLAGTDIQTRAVAVEGDSSITCGAPIADPPATASTLQHAGSVGTDTAGSGLEFYATRQYNPGDPMNRINWHQVAKTGEFVTVQYRRERAARTVLVVDCRPCTRVRRNQGYPTAGSLSVYVAERLYDALGAAGVVRTLTAVGLDSDDAQPLLGPDGLPWVSPDAPSGASIALFEQATKVATDTTSPANDAPVSSAVSSLDTGGRTGVSADGGPTQDERVERLRSRIPGEAEVIVCSPLLDDWPVTLAESLSAHGHQTLVVSPDVTGGTSTGQRIDGLSRRLRLRALARLGVDVTDWPSNYPVEYALERTLSQL
ncbi:DUF58 domain-containing protein [Halovenus halobia]|uniref:DUF58 domain-containing protein n=1 Tax=Halovenus halobia TaxID=3396622 RepID=UPI003F557CC2